MKQSSKNWLFLLICGIALTLAAILVLAFNELIIRVLLYIIGFAMLAAGVALVVFAFMARNSGKDKIAA